MQGDDPTHGYVNYVDQGTAQNQGLIGQRDGTTYMGVDYTNVANGRGRNSVRLTSKNTYTHGLIVLDLQHMPGGQCGAWPAFWTFGPDWPRGGEIDIIEGVNSQAANDMTLHTTAGCTISNTGAFSGQITTPNCDVNAPGQYTNAGCQIASYDTATYGAGFNANGGGVYATDWTSDAISIWFFRRGSIPDDLARGNPNPSGWGKPAAKFEGGCDIDKYFQNHNIIFDVTFCGDWAGNVWAQDSVCSSRASSCQAFVQNNPGAFSEAFWQINSLKVYQSNGQAMNQVVAVNAADSEPVASPQAAGSAEATSAETSSAEATSTKTSTAEVTLTEMSTSSTLGNESTTPPSTPTPTPPPAPTTLATSSQKTGSRTATALRWDHFGSLRHGRPARASSKEKRSVHAKHLLQHQHKAHA